MTEKGHNDQLLAKEGSDLSEYDEGWLPVLELLTQRGGQVVACCAGHDWDDDMVHVSWATKEVDLRLVRLLSSLLASRRELKLPWELKLLVSEEGACWTLHTDSPFESGWSPRYLKKVNLDILTIAKELVTQITSAGTAGQKLPTA